MIDYEKEMREVQRSKRIGRRLSWAVLTIAGYAAVVMGVELVLRHWKMASLQVAVILLNVVTWWSIQQSQRTVKWQENFLIDYARARSAMVMEGELDMRKESVN